MNKSIKHAVKPRANFTDNNENIMFLKFVGGGSAAINVSTSPTIAKGYPTIVTLASTPSCIAGQTIKLSSVGGMTEINGYQKVLAVYAGNKVALDVDSSNFTAHTTGGSMSFVTVADQFGNHIPVELAGSPTSIWSNNGLGVTCDSLGTWVPKEVGSALFNLQSATGKVVISTRIQLGVAPTLGTEMIFGMNNIAGTVNNGTRGGLNIGFYGGSQNPTLYFRPASAVDAAGGTTVSCAAGAIGTASSTAQWIIDFDTDVIYTYLNGSYVSSTTIDRTLSVRNPVSSGTSNTGVVLLGSLNDSGTVVTPMGAQTSAAKIKHLMWWKTTKSLSDVTRILRSLALTDEFPAHLL